MSVTLSVTTKPKKFADKPLLKALNRLAELEDAAREHEALEKMVKEEMKGKGEGSYQCGPWRISVENRNRTTYEVPQEIKDQYKGEGVSVYVEWRKV